MPQVCRLSVGSMAVTSLVAPHLFMDCLSELQELVAQLSHYNAHTRKDALTGQQLCRYIAPSAVQQVTILQHTHSCYIEHLQAGRLDS
jgi:hypothetical protein